MLRLVLQRIHTGDAVNIGGPVVTRIHTFDFDLPDAEKHLRKQDAWNSVQVVGVEVLDEKDQRSE